MTRVELFWRTRHGAMPDIGLRGELVHSKQSTLERKWEKATKVLAGEAGRLGQKHTMAQRLAP